jgi:hypothetical protein
MGIHHNGTSLFANVVGVGMLAYLVGYLIWRAVRRWW